MGQAREDEQGQDSGYISKEEMTRLTDGSYVGRDRKSRVHTLLWPLGGVGAGCRGHSQARRDGILIWAHHGGRGETWRGLNWKRKEHNFF